VPSLDLRTKPKAWTAGTKVQDRARHIRVSALVEADRIALGEAEDVGHLMSINQVIQQYSSRHRRPWPHARHRPAERQSSHGAFAHHHHRAITSNRPLATFRSVGLVALPRSFIPDVAIWLTAHYPQTRAATVLPLMAMHVLVATVCLVALPRIGQTQTSA
jgi:hypothetical protein